MSLSGHRSHPIPECTPDRIFSGQGLKSAYAPYFNPSQTSIGGVFHVWSLPPHEGKEGGPSGTSFIGCCFCSSEHAFEPPCVIQSFLITAYTTAIKATITAQIPMMRTLVSIPTVFSTGTSTFSTMLTYSFSTSLLTSEVFSYVTVY